MQLYKQVKFVYLSHAIIYTFDYRIIEPLTSRCSKFRFKPLSVKVLSSRLDYIIREEGVKCQEGVTEQMIQASGGDLRKAITLLQSASHLKGTEEVTCKDIEEIAGVSLWHQLCHTIIIKLQLVPASVIEALLNVCYLNSYEQLEVKVHDLLIEGYAVSQVLSQLHDMFIFMDSITDSQKSVIAERMGVSRE